MEQLYCGDHIEIMKDFPSENIDLTVTSPPYDKLRDYDGYTFDFESLANELHRLTRKGGIVVWVVGDQVKNHNESGTSFRQALYFQSIGFNLFDTMIFAKKPRPNNTIGYYQSFEYMFVFSKDVPKTINVIMDRPNRDTRGKQKATQRQRDGALKPNTYKGHGKFGRRTNIWEYAIGYGSISKDKIAYKHPAIFPEKLAEDHILSWSNEGDLVFDPMMGSGTTGKMALKHHRKFIGIDISAEYVNVARQRLGIYNGK